MVDRAFRTSFRDVVALGRDFPSWFLSSSLFSLLSLLTSSFHSVPAISPASYQLHLSHGSHARHCPPPLSPMPGRVPSTSQPILAFLFFCALSLFVALLLPRIFRRPYPLSMIMITIYRPSSHHALPSIPPFHPSSIASLISNCTTEKGCALTQTHAHTAVVCHTSRG